jgi:hypothetical protein
MDKEDGNKNTENSPKPCGTSEQWQSRIHALLVGFISGPFIRWFILWLDGRA